MKRPIVLSRPLKESLVAKQVIQDKYRGVTDSMIWHWNHKPYANDRILSKTLGKEA